MSETQGWILITIVGLFLLDRAYMHFARWKEKKKEIEMFDQGKHWWTTRFEFSNRQTEKLLFLIGKMNEVIPELAKAMREASSRVTVSQWKIEDNGEVFHVSPSVGTEVKS
jgi:hypothetical protein